MLQWILFLIVGLGALALVPTLGWILHALNERAARKDLEKMKPWS